MKNHEGYQDPTAGKAIRRFRRKRHAPKVKRLTYPIGDAAGFKEVCKKMLSAK